MTTRWLKWVLILLWIALVAAAAVPAAAQPAARPADRTATRPAPIGNPRDFSGIWTGGAIDITALLLPGEEVSLTRYGAERYKSNNYAKSPANTCMPYGVTRAMHSTDPQQWVQTPG